MRFALDDFGTGDSSLSYLMRFPVDTIKVDRTFVANLGRDRASESIVSAVIALSHDLGMTVVSKGVETAEQHDRLTGLGCDCCQGFYFAAPMLASSLDMLIHDDADRSSPRLPMRSPITSTQRQSERNVHAGTIGHPQRAHLPP